MNINNLPEQYNTPESAWTTGFIQGVTLSLSNDEKIAVLDFSAEAHDELTIWQNIGRDIPNGIWAILGARMGCYMTLITPTWDYNQINNSDELHKLFVTIENTDPEIVSARVAEDLMNELNLPIVMLFPNESAFFRYYIKLLQK